MEGIRKHSLYRIEASAISIIAMLFIFRASCPFFKYPYIIFYSGFLCYFVLKYHTEILTAIAAFLKSQALPLVLLLIMLLSLIFSDKTYLVILKEILNALILFTFFFILFVTTDSQKRLTEFARSFQLVLIGFGIFISLIQLVELFGILPHHEFLSGNHIFSNLLRVTNEFDYNFAIIPLLLGLLALLNLLRNSNTLRGIVIINILFILFSGAIFLSGSFRGLIVLTVIYSTLYIYRIVTLINKKRFRFNSVIISNAVILVVLLLFIRVASGSIKTNALEFVGSKNIREVKVNIAAYLYKYVSFLDKRTSPGQFYVRIWTPDYDPKDPDSGWGTRIHSDVYPLTGNNSVILPKGAIGYMMDHRSDADSSDPEYIRIWSSIHLKNSGQSDTNYVASIYCFASEDFNCAYTRLYCSKALSYYDLNHKGTWQLLKIKFSSRKIIPVEFEWAVPRGTDIKTVKGYVIFSYPQYVNSNYSELSYNRVSYNLAGFTVNGANIFGAMHSFSEYDPVGRWIKRFFEEDTIYKAPKTTLIPDLTKENVINNRTLRWKFAWQIFRNEYNLKDKLIGRGFTYLNWYGYYFLKDKTASEYPHNPFLNILLYSGILGLLLYLFLMLKVLIYYSNYRSEYAFFALSFLIVYFFALLSGSSPFDPPAMGFFIILPFFIRSIYTKTNPTQAILSANEENTDNRGQ